MTPTSPDLRHPRAANYRIVHHPDDLPDFTSTQKIVIDTETSGNKPWTGDRICGISLGALDEKTVYYIPVRHVDDIRNMSIKVVKEWLQELFDDPTKIWIMHNAKFDRGFFRKEGLEIKGRIIDTMIFAHGAISSDLFSYGLDKLTKIYCAEFTHVYYEAVYQWFLTQGIDIKSKKQEKITPNFSLVPLDLLAPYACEDIEATRLLYYVCVKFLKEEYKEGDARIPNSGNPTWDQKQLIANEMKCMEVTSDMEYRGVRIDQRLWRDYYDQTTAEVEELSSKLFIMAGYSFMVTSALQVAKAFEDFGGKILFWNKKNNKFIKQKAAKYTRDKAASTGRPCFNSAAIADYIREYQKTGEKHLMDFILTYYHLDHRNRLKSSYLKPISSNMDWAGNLHGNFDQTGTVHGRYSSWGPNLQNQTNPDGNKDQAVIEKLLSNKGWWNPDGVNISDADALNRKLRYLFVPRPGYLWVSLDWKQIEYVVATYFAQDEKMIKLFYENPDLDYHQITADLAGISRAVAKTVNFGTLYGMGAGSLSSLLGIHLQEAKNIIAKVFNARPALKGLIDRLSQQGARDGYIRNPFGRKVYIPKDKSYVALNYKVAGTVGDAIKAKMVEIQNFLVEFKVPAAMLLTVHDELDFEVREDVVEEIVPQFIRIMCNIPQIKMPIRASAEVGTSWGGVEDFDKWVEARKQARQQSNKLVA